MRFRMVVTCCRGQLGRLSNGKKDNRGLGVKRFRVRVSGLGCRVQNFLNGCY